MSQQAGGITLKVRRHRLRELRVDHGEGQDHYCYPCTSAVTRLDFHQESTGLFAKDVTSKSLMLEDLAIKPLPAFVPDAGRRHFQMIQDSSECERCAIYSFHDYSWNAASSLHARPLPPENPYAAPCLPDTDRSRVPLAISTPALGQEVLAYITYIATK